MKNLLIVTGGCGFVGSNLINYLVQNTNYKIISLDDYSSGIKKNQIKNKNVKYIKDNYMIKSNFYMLTQKHDFILNMGAGDCHNLWTILNNQNIFNT